MGKFEQFLLSIGYEVFYYKGGEWKPFPSNLPCYYSTMGNIHFIFKKDGCVSIRMGLSEVGKPATLIHPRPVGIRNDDEMNAFIDSNSPQTILDKIIKT